MMINIDEKNKKNSVLLTNKKGSYCFFSPYPRSKYEGVFFMSGSRLYKIIDRIRVNGEVKSIKNNYWNIQRFFGDFSERFFMPHNHNCLVYQTSKVIDFDVLLDGKESYDNREWGRNYRIEEKKGMTIITFTKTTSRREDSSEGKQEYKIYLVIKGNFQPSINDSWEEEYYEYDDSRKSFPFKRYVYNALRISGKKVVFAFSDDLKKAIKEAGYVNRKIGMLMEKQHHYTEKLLHKSGLHIPDTDLNKAYKSSVVAIDSLSAVIDKLDGIYAGIPWFFQFWTRDEAISLKSLMIIGQLKKAEKILLRQISDIRHDGRIPNRYPMADLGSADGIGWVFKRTADFIGMIEKMHIVKKFMSLRTKMKIMERLEHTIYLTIKYHEKEGLVYNKANETWMDTSYGPDSREGKRIEIQTLLLSMLSLMYTLSRDKRYLEKEEKLRTLVRKNFLSDGFLLDGVGDTTIRPNIFLAAYIYPELLSDEEWESAFDKILPRLWEKWGGVASLDKKNPRFCGEYIAEHDKSYHRGDSWYFINNILAIVLYRLNKEKYGEEIDTIINASTREIVYSGITGYHAELSSARHQKSEGCLAQAWSSATFVELVWEIYGNKKH